MRAACAIAIVTPMCVHQIGRESHSVVGVKYLRSTAAAAAAVAQNQNRSRAQTLALARTHIGASLCRRV